MERAPNAEQRLVIEDLENNLIVFASAGTGKTFTVAKRVARIIKTERALPQEILCLTFTTKACDEMREDIARYVGEKSDGVEIRTIHGFCYRLLREEHRRSGAKYSEATVCDEVDAEELLRSILSSQYPLWEGGVLPAEGEEGEREYEPAVFDIYWKKTALRTLITALKHAREELELYTEDGEADYQKAFSFLRAKREKTYREILSYRAKSGGQVCDEAFERAMSKYAGRLAEAYDRQLKQSNRLDYDDLIVLANRLLREREIRERWEKRYKYIIVDEMQDTSLIEYAVLKKIFGANNLMMCGDFFQSIYEWRGSKPEIVLQDFVKTYQAKTYAFSENYRSTQTLANAAFAYLCESYPALLGKYVPKSLRIHNADEGEKILCCGFDNRREEARQIYNYIKKKAIGNEGGLCVMTRSNGYISSLARSFAEFNACEKEEERLFFYTAEDNLHFYKKPIIKDILAVMRLLLNASDCVSAERIARKYVRMVGEKSIEQLRLQNALGVSIATFLDKRTFEDGEPYHRLIESFQKGNIVVYDTETTGLDLGTDEAVQISAIRLDSKGNITASFDKMILPKKEIERGAYETHGFDIAYIKAHGGVTAKEALQAFSSFVKGATLVGHNSARFDAPLIRRQLKENGLPPLEIGGEYDTLTLAKAFPLGTENYKLSTLCERYGIVNEAAHNAYGDIVATGKVLCKLIEEEIKPTVLERRALCAKYAPKFEKFYRFLEGLRSKIERGELAGLAEEIYSAMRMETRYKEPSDRKAVSELAGILRTAKEGEGEAFLRELVANADLTGSRSEKLFAKQNRIPILTVHQAKGCEFDWVILAGADDTNFPNAFAEEANAEDEEKKVFYVAITRAKKRLILTRAAYSGYREVPPSRFVKRIPEKYLSKNSGWEATEE